MTNGKSNGKNGKVAKTAPATGAGDWLEAFARNVAMATGRPFAFLLAVALVLAWAVSGPFFGYSEMWQMVINTGTTIVTFLMVFLIQRAQNLDTMALQAKLAELIIAIEGAQNRVAVAEHLSERELTELHEEHAERAEEQGVEAGRASAHRAQASKKRVPAKPA